VVAEGEVCVRKARAGGMPAKRVQLDGKGAGARGVLLLWASRLGDGPKPVGFNSRV